MNNLTIGLLQLYPHGNSIEQNYLKGIEYCLKAKQNNVDIILFPEMWLNGYKPFEGNDPWKNQAIPTDSEYIKKFQNLAKELNVAIVMTYLQKWDPAPRNVATLIDRHGDIKMTYAKVHTCDFRLLEATLVPGEEFHVTELDTAVGPIKVGIMICMDRGYPESARILMLKGAEFILVPNESILDEPHLCEFSSRASENTVGVAVASYPFTKKLPELAYLNSNGHSAVYDEEGSKLVEAGEHEQIIYCQFDIEKLRNNRKETCWGNSFRKAHRYQLLTDLNVSDPFKRKNAFGDDYEPQKR
jgi:predicted amidohydrolase